MEPLNDRELGELLPTWKAPDPPEHLHRQIFGARSSTGWAWLFTGSIRVPVPACAAILLILAWLVVNWSADPTVIPLPDRPTEVTLADFQPPAEIQVKVIGGVR